LGLETGSGTYAFRRPLGTVKILLSHRLQMVSAELE
jgi:hypothetical protein